MRRLVLIAITLGVGALHAEPEEEPFRHERLERFRATLGEILARNEIPGLGAVIATREKVIWSGGLGVEDTVSERPVTEGTVFRIGSITKSFVAVAAMMLVEEGRLDLQTPLRELAPEIEFTNRWEESAPVRIVHLLEHTAGWSDWSLRKFAHNVYPPVSLREGLAFEPRSRTSRWPPGRSVSYCNSGPAVAAYVIQKLAGTEFEQFVQERIFVPLDMPTSTFRGEGTTSLRLAAGYHRGKRVPYLNLLQRPAGAINSSPREMANFLRFFLNEGELDGRRLVKPESIDRILEARSPRAVKAGVELWYGLNIIRSVQNGQVWYGHTGAMAGYRAALAWCPALEVGYVAMINSSSREGFQEVRSAFRDFLSAGHDPVPLPPPFATGPGELDACSGYYVPDTPRQEFDRVTAALFGVVRVQAGSEGLDLWPVRGEPSKLIATGERLFRRPDQHLASAVFYSGDGEGEASLGTAREYRRVPAAYVWAHWIGGGVALILMLSTVLFALIWIPRLLFGRRLRHEPFLSVRVLPLLSTLSFAAMIALFVRGQLDAIANFGKPTFWSVGVTVSTLLFALTALGGFCLSFGSKHSGINSGVRWHGILASGGQVLMALYLAYYGMIGWQSWA